MIGLFGQHSYLCTLSKGLPRHCDCIPMICVLGDTLYQMILTVHTRLTCVLVKSK